MSRTQGVSQRTRPCQRAQEQHCEKTLSHTMNEVRTEEFRRQATREAEKRLNGSVQKVLWDESRRANQETTCEVVANAE